MSLIAAKVLSNPTKRAWAQVYDGPGETENQVDSLGHLVAALSLQVDDELIGEDITEVGRQLLTALRESYFNGEGTPFERLSQTVARIGDEFARFSVEAAFCVVWRDYVYLSCGGGGAVWIAKDGRFIHLTSQGPISGKIESEEIFLLGTKGFFDCVATSTVLQEIGGGKTPDEIADILGPLIHRKEEPTAAAVVVRVKSPGAVLTVPPTGLLPALKSKLTTLARKLPDRTIELGVGEEKRRRTALSAGIILLIILAVSIVLGLRQKGISQRKSFYEGRLAQAQSFYRDSLTQKDVDSAGAREKFLQAKGLVETMLSEGVKDDNLAELATQINQQEGAVLGRVAASPGLFLDLTLARAGVQAVELGQHEDKLVVLDKGGQRLFLVSSVTKQTSVVGGAGKISAPRSVTVYDDRLFVLAEAGVVELDQRAAGSARVVLEKDEEWGNVGKIGVFGGNIYLLSQEGIVWRYPSTDSGFGQKQMWFAKDVRAFPDAVDWTIDGSIWVLSTGGNIAKFTRGAPDSFRVVGVDGGLAGATAIYTNDQLDSVFVLQKGEGRVVQIGKDGKYKLSYLAEEAKQAEDFVVSAVARKIFLLTPSKILEIPLR